MNGTAHTVIGAATGFTVANLSQSSPSTTLVLVGLGAISSLIPDLDVGGKLRGKITLSHRIIKSIAQLIGFLLVIYSFYNGTDSNMYIGVVAGLVILVVASAIQQKHMLTLTGAVIVFFGSSIQEVWLLLLGVYIVIASLVSHRSYTHSILGGIFFAFISHKLEASIQIEGIYYTCLAGYISHLIADSKLLPFNKRGVKLFLPISSKEL